MANPVLAKAFNGKILLITLLAAGGIAAILGIGQIWFDLLAMDDFIRALVTIIVVGVLAGFLMAVDYDIPASREKAILLSLVVLALIMGGLLIAQLWWLALEWALFFKIFGTVLILFVLVSFVAAIKEDFGTNKKLKDENYID
ncbi:MAG: hypothetical protein H6867_10165 [Rhodospirillales bacterium]|nr:hypothetical protein [Rhodospirillales bacterium]MCB9995852.1 hypothetical protein [Rhodospirillales bacterium]